MRISPEQLETHLARQLLPVYALSGDEPLQLQEAGDAVRHAARRAGHLEWELFLVEGQFDWTRVRLALESGSLFGERKRVDLRLPNGPPPKDGARLIEAYLKRPAEDVILTLTLPRLSASEQKAAWLRAVEDAGALVQIWPLEGTALTRWLDRRLKARGLEADPATLALLAQRVEGNLLAAQQEIDRLYALNGPGHLTRATLEEATSDQSRFDVYALSDAVLLGQTARARHILDVLNAEGTAAPVVLWALTREIRQLLHLARRTRTGATLDTALRELRLPDRRKPAISHALRRLSSSLLYALLSRGAACDRAIKGMERGDPWILLLDLTVGLAHGGLPDSARLPGYSRARMNAHSA